MPFPVIAGPAGERTMLRKKAGTAGLADAAEAAAGSTAEPAIPGTVVPAEETIEEYYQE